MNSIGTLARNTFTYLQSKVILASAVVAVCLFSFQDVVGQVLPADSWTVQATQRDFSRGNYTLRNDAYGKPLYVTGQGDTIQNYNKDIYENLSYTLNTDKGAPAAYDIEQIDAGYDDRYIYFKMTLVGFFNKGYYYFELNPNRELEGQDKADHYIRYDHNADISLSQTAWSQKNASFISTIQIFRDDDNDLGGDNPYLSDFGVATVKADARKVLAEVMNKLKEDPAYKVSLNGHTDESGPDLYNDKLAALRASKTGEYLKKIGVPDAVIFFNSFGKKVPVIQGANRRTARFNRRVEISISK